jgi:hypothetical protein
MISTITTAPPQFRRSAAEHITDTLAASMTSFHRLLYLARCRDADGQYRHEGMELMYDAAEIDTALRTAHETAWFAWLSLDLRHQCDDLLTYLAGTNIKRVLKNWFQTEPWFALAPPSAAPHERDLFASDFRRLLELLDRVRS